MSAGGPRPTEELRAGRRAIEGVPGVKLLRDLAWDAGLRRWTLLVRIALDVPAGSPIPPSTDWIVHLPPTYPLGKVKLYPAKVGGVRGTFPHQSYNADPPRGARFRLGDLCLNQPGALVPWSKESSGPRLHPYWLLRWHVARAREWLRRASVGTLLERGHPYELPAWPERVETETVVFAEGSDTFAPWQAASARVGYAIVAEIREGYLAVLEWTDLAGAVVARTRWGCCVLDAVVRMRAGWILLDEPPTLPPWRAPRTWGELRRAAGRQGLGIDAPLRRLMSRHDPAPPSLLLVGFPIPKDVGGPAREVHWQPCQMPWDRAPPSEAPRQRGRRRSDRPQGFLHGFRDNALGRWQNVRQGLLSDKRVIPWMRSENWHPERIGARGRYMETFRLSRFALLGVGAVGSLIAELLVRGGVEDLLLVDGDDLAMGNLVRHKLRMNALGENKAFSLAEELNITSPHARVRAHKKALSWSEEEARALLEDREIIIDCTAEDDVLYALSRLSWVDEKRFASISVGREAHRLYFFSAKDLRFPFVEFTRRARPWMDEEWGGADGDQLQMEGPGCWHPVFPARCDDIMLMAAAATKLVEASFKRPLPELHVFERQTGPAGMFEGMRRVHPPERDPSRDADP